MVSSDFHLDIMGLFLMQFLYYRTIKRLIKSSVCVYDNIRKQKHVWSPKIVYI